MVSLPAALDHPFGLLSQNMTAVRVSIRLNSRIDTLTAVIFSQHTQNATWSDCIDRYRAFCLSSRQLPTPGALRESVNSGKNFVTTPEGAEPMLCF